MADTKNDVVLSCPLEGGNYADAETVKDYLKTILFTIWQDPPKRMFGESDWQFEVYKGLVRAGLVKGIIDEEFGYLDEVDEAEADKLILEAIKAL